MNATTNPALETNATSNPVDAPARVLGSVDAPPAANLWAFDHKLAVAHITKNDARLAQLIAQCVEFRLNIEPAQSPYEALLEAIVYQSISGKAAATIFARIAALGANGRCPTPQEILKLRKSALRKAGLSFAKIAAAKDLAQKTIDGIVPTLEDAEKMSDEELVERLDSVRGIGAWTVEMFFDFPPRPPRRAPHSRLRRAKGICAHLRQKENSQAARTRQVRRTLASLSHRSLVVHVARRGVGG